VEALALYAGQTAGLVTHLLPAAAIVDQLVSDAATALAPPHRSRRAARRAAARSR
jgi:hypothetical protein